MYNTYRFSTATVVARTHLNVNVIRQVPVFTFIMLSLFNFILFFFLLWHVQRSKIESEHFFFTPSTQLITKQSLITMLATCFGI
jgi:hypothetical protein